MIPRRKTNSLRQQCFTAGTWINTDRGRVAVEDLVAGDLIKTKDNGLQELCWLGRSKHRAVGNCAPVVFEIGAIGNTEKLIVSQQHGMLVQSNWSELWLSEYQVLVAAKHLVNGSTIRVVPGHFIEYFPFDV